MAENEAAIKKRDVEFRTRVNRIFVNWIGWKVMLPLLLISSIYLFIRCILEIPEPFGRAFAHGDLLVFSALVLLEAASEGEHLPGQSTMMDIVRMAAKISAILFIVCFVATKGDVLKKEYAVLTAARETVTAPVNGDRVNHGAEAPSGQTPAPVKQSIKDHDDSNIDTNEDHLAKKMVAYSFLNWTVALVAVVSSILIFWFNLDREKKQDYQRLGETDV